MARLLTGVVATGGGAVLREENQQLLSRGTVVYLELGQQAAASGSKPTPTARCWQVTKHSPSGLRFTKSDALFTKCWLTCMLWSTESPFYKLSKRFCRNSNSCD
ncbi:hypothetical protein D3791_00005 [Glutamicibacter mishrai]|uniref:Uncharacterized protein n=1 Tax=Glutamicibacter mishrai TaxID=1775880 RepID=A0A6H0SDC3_9MICC|nr:hypothetical protein D3791_00005 [Glutamicibacter mishrai]